MAGPQAPGVQEMNDLQQAGFTQNEIDQWKADTTSQLQDAGFNSQEVDDYFGVKTPDMNATKGMFAQNVQKNLAVAPAAPATPVEGEAAPVDPERPQIREAQSFIEAMEAGFDMSVTGLIKGRPDVVLPEHAPMFFRIASQVSQLAGDVPAMIAGGVIGGSVGAAAGGAAGTATVPVLGTIGGVAFGGAAGTLYGSMALPEAMRTVMMQHYEKGDVQSFADFWERTSAAFINSTKAGVTGLITGGVGAKVGGVLVPVLAKTSAAATTQALVKTTAQVTSEVATMTTVGAALDGRLPEPSEFIDGAIVTAGLIGSVKVATKIRNTYGKHGVAPLDVVKHAEENAKFKQEMLADNVPAPKAPELGINPVAEKAPENIPTVKPLNEKAYHGTFAEFKPEDIAPSKNGKYGEGFYLTKDEISAKNYGDKVLEFNINTSKVLDVTDAASKSLIDFASKQGFEIKPGKDPYMTLLSEVRKKFPNENLVGTAANKKINELLKQEGYEGIQFSQNDSNANLLMFDRASFKTGGEMTLADGTKTRITNINLSPEVNKILSKVSDQPDKVKKPLTSTSELYTNFVDKLDPINQATKQLEGATKLLAEDNPYVLARTSVDAPAKAKHFFENGVLDYKTLENKGGSLKSVLESVENVEVLEAYMISKRVVEKSAQGLSTGFDVASAQKVVGEHAAKYEKAAQQVTEFSNKVLEYVSDAGIISKDKLEVMKTANKDYVPFKRIMDADGEAGGKRQGKAGSLKEFKGSERDIQSPVLSIVENTVELLKMAENNRPKEALVKLAESIEGQDLIKRVKSPVEEISVSKEQVAKQLGITLEAAEAVTTFRAVKKDLAPNQFSVYREGKRQIFETTPELAEALKRLDGDGTATNLLFKMMNGITAVKKFGITFTPDFIIRNFFRDTLTANTFSTSKSINPFDVVSAIGDIWKKNDTYYNWLKSGGANGAFLEMGDRYVKTDIYKLHKETGLLGAARNVIEKPIEVMRVAAELTEQSLRVAEFKKVREKGGSLTAGGYASREITIDFQRVGAKISALNSITAFMNVSIQGLDRTARAFKENPTGVATKSLAYITVPSVLLWWANKDDERYQQIPRWEKDMFWIIPTDSWQQVTPDEAAGLPEYLVRERNGNIEVNKGTIYRLPKPQELGIIFGSLPERTLEKFFTENPKSYKEFGQTMLGLVTPSFVPDAVAPAIEQYFNKSFFTGRDIIPHHLAGVLPEYQFVEYTSETAKAIGKMVSTVDRNTNFASPMVLQNYIRSWGGNLGQYAVQVADKALIASGVAEDKVKPTSTLADVPFVKSFVVRYPMAGTNAVQDFQDNFKESKKIMDTIRHLAKEGDFNSVEKEFTLQANQEKLVQLDGIQEALSNQSKLIRLVNKNPDMSPDEKRQIIDGAYLMMTEVAKQGNLLMQEIKTQLGEK